jgi:hypothetical protein
MKTYVPNSIGRPLAFNSPIECGLRSAVLLASSYPQRFDIQRLVQYDYLLVHSGDVEAGPPSIHPPTPNRSGELLVRRPLIEVGIKLMMSKSVIECEMSVKGVFYFAGDWALMFLDSLQANYTTDLKERAKWVIEHFARFSDAELTDFMRKQWSNWGAEFEFEALVSER